MMKDVYEAYADGSPDIRTWRDGSPAAEERQRETLSHTKQWIDVIDDLFVEAKERKAALIALNLWIKQDLVWRCEPFEATSDGWRAYGSVAGAAQHHGCARHVGEFKRSLSDGAEAAERERRMARIADANGGDGAPTGRSPAPVWAVPPALRLRLSERSNGRFLPPCRHGLPDGEEWWAVGSDGILRRFRTVIKRAPDGAESEEVKITVIAPHPIWITERGHDVENGQEVVTLAWREESGPGPADSGWRTKTVSRAVIADPKKLIELAQDGAPVTAGDVARGMVDWLADLVADRTSRGVIGEAAAVAPRLGWMGSDPGAPLGWIGPVAVDGSPGWCGVDEDARPVRLMAPDGLEALASSLRPAGKATALADVLATATPTLWCAVGAALASPLLRPLGVKGWILDVAGATSGGKTSALTVAAAVWGNPDALIRTWRDTDVFLFRTAAFLANIPVFVDDTKTENDPTRIARVVYSLTSGTERGRGSADGGVRALHTWRSVGILTGEQPLTSFSSDAGTRARVLPLWGQVFRSADEAEAAVTAASRSWGHLGAGFVRHLCSPGQIERARGLCDEWGEWLRSQVGDDGVALRLRLPAATILTALALATEAGLVTITDAQWSAVRTALLKSIRAGAADADQPLAALLAAEGARVSHPDRWPLAAGAAVANETPSAGWDGIFDPEAGIAYWIPTKLDAALAKAGFRPTEILARWQDRGWRALDDKGNNPRRVLSGSRTRFVAVKLTAALPEYALEVAEKRSAAAGAAARRAGKGRADSERDAERPGALAWDNDPSLPVLDGTDDN
jgi:hypothetical protein